MGEAGVSGGVGSEDVRVGVGAGNGVVDEVVGVGVAVGGVSISLEGTRTSGMFSVA